MKIQIDRLSESPSTLEFEGNDEWWHQRASGGAGLPGTLPDSLHFRVEVHCMGEDLYLEGRAQGEVLLECSRCLARYRQRLAEPFRLVLEPAGSRLPADPEGAEALVRDGLCLGEEVETGWFKGKELDLGAFFREVLSLALPVKPLCRDDCGGLCPRCGVDRNREACDCRETEIESPFAVLKTLRLGRTEGDS